ncbi:MAG: thiamine-binding protein [Bacteroidales bacterium]|nr:thiamine-binding protein [Bacteroidales bacterium]
MEPLVNIAVQLLPLNYEGEAYTIIDKAILEIKKSGLSYRVCPFETVIEGEYKEIMEVIERVQQACFDNGGEELILNIKIHRNKLKDITIGEKMDKYDDNHISGSNT